MIRIDCSFWSARAKLQREDLPLDVQQSMPPEQIATLGTKRLFDPGKLKVFNTLKARAHNALDKKCVRFLGGWATHEDKLPELAQQLATISQDFDYETQQFLDQYVEGVASWAANFPGWENILLNAVPKVHELRGKFNFSWQVFKIEPVQNMDNFTGNDLNSTLMNLEQSVIDEVAKDIKTIYRECFDGKEQVTKKAFRPMQTLIDKVRGLGFIHHSLVGLQEVLEEAKTLGESSPDDSRTVGMIKSFLTTLSTSQGIQAICDNFYEKNKNLPQVLDPFWMTTPVNPFEINTSPDGFPKLPPGWIPNPENITVQTSPGITTVSIPGVSYAQTDDVSPKVTKEFIAQAMDAINAYEDKKLGLEPLDFEKTVVMDGDGLW